MKTRRCVAWALFLAVACSTGTPVASSTEQPQMAEKMDHARAIVRMYVHRQVATSSNNHPMVLEHRHVLCHLQYDANSTTTTTTTTTPTTTALQAACCRSMFSASAAALGPSGGTMLLFEPCLAKSAVVPPLDLQQQDTTTTTTTQQNRSMVQVSWTQTHRIMHVEDTTPWFMHKVFVWDSTGYLTDGEWFDLAPNNNNEINIARAVERGLLLPAGQYLLLDATTAQHSNNNNTDDDALPIDLVSTLSQSGGMHRRMLHELKVLVPPPPPPPPPEQQQNSVLYYLDAWIYLFVPDTMFIDVEDAVDYHHHHHHSNNKWNIYNTTIITHPDLNSIIDMEQPAMVSPQHVVLLHVQASIIPTTTNDNDNDNPLQPLNIATKWHARYPNPIDDDNNNNNDAHDGHKYRPILITPPLLAGGSIRDNATTGSGIHYSLRPVEPPPSNHPRLFLLVAAAQAKDFEGVAIVTVLCSIAGALLVVQQMHATLRSKLL